MTNFHGFRTYDMGLKGAQGLASFLEYHDFSCDQLPPDEEFHPHTVKHEDGEHTIEGFSPPPPLSIDRPPSFDDSCGLTS